MRVRGRKAGCAFWAASTRARMPADGWVDGRPGERRRAAGRASVACLITSASIVALNELLVKHARRAVCPVCIIIRQRNSNDWAAHGVAQRRSALCRAAAMPRRSGRYIGPCHGRSAFNSRHIYSHRPVDIMEHRLSHSVALSYPQSLYARPDCSRRTPGGPKAASPFSTSVRTATLGPLTHRRE